MQSLELIATSSLVSSAAQRLVPEHALLSCIGDVTDAEAVSDAGTRITGELGAIDTVVSVAGHHEMIPFSKITVGVKIARTRVITSCSRSPSRRFGDRVTNYRDGFWNVEFEPTRATCSREFRGGEDQESVPFGGHQPHCSDPGLFTILTNSPPRGHSSP